MVEKDFPFELLDTAAERLELAAVPNRSFAEIDEGHRIPRPMVAEEAGRGRGVFAERPDRIGELGEGGYP